MRAVSRTYFPTFADPHSALRVSRHLFSAISRDSTLRARAAARLTRDRFGGLPEFRIFYTPVRAHRAFAPALARTRHVRRIRAATASGDRRARYQSARTHRAITRNLNGLVSDLHLAIHPFSSLLSSRASRAWKRVAFRLIPPDSLDRTGRVTAPRALVTKLFEKLVSAVSTEQPSRACVRACVRVSAGARDKLVERAAAAAAVVAVAATSRCEDD